MHHKSSEISKTERPSVYNTNQRTKAPNNAQHLERARAHAQIVVLFIRQSLDIARDNHLCRLITNSPVTVTIRLFNISSD